MTNEQKELFQYYYNLMSKEFRKEILGYDDFKMDNVKCSIKVNFRNGSWIRIYKNNNNKIEWY